MDRYFNRETGLALDKNVLTGVMLQKGLTWKDLSPYQKGALYRLTVYGSEAQREGMLREDEVEFLRRIGAGQVPEAGTEERKLFDTALSETEFVEGGLSVETED